MSEEILSAGGPADRIAALEAGAAVLRQSLEECKRLSDSVVHETDIIDPDWIGQEAARALASTDAGAALLAELAAPWRPTTRS